MWEALEEFQITQVKDAVKEAIATLFYLPNAAEIIAIIKKQRLQENERRSDEMKKVLKLKEPADPEAVKGIIDKLFKKMNWSRGDENEKQGLEIPGHGQDIHS